MKKTQQIVKVPFRAFVTNALAAGVASFGLSPGAGLSNRLNTISDAFEMYRFTKLHFRILPSDVSATAKMAVCFVPADLTTAPSTVVQCFDTNLVSYWAGFEVQTVPGDWVEVPPAVLSGLFPWYRTQGGGGTTEESTQGQFYVVGTGTQNYCVDIRGVVELKGIANTGNTPQSRLVIKNQKDAAERERLLRLVCGPTVTAPYVAFPTASSKGVGT
jgi:hypothetical protein